LALDPHEQHPAVAAELHAGNGVGELCRFGRRLHPGAGCPKVQGAVLGDREEGLSLGHEAGQVNRIFVRERGAEHLARGGVPQAGGLVARSGGHERAIRAEAGGVNRAFVVAQRGHGLIRQRVPNPGNLVGPGAHEPAAIGAELQIADRLVAAPAVRVQSEVLGGGVAAGGVLLEAFEAYRFEVPVNGGIPPAQGRGLGLEHFHHGWSTPC
jgi:hypothetical protein